MIECCYYKSPIGILKIEAKDHAVCRLEICLEGVESADPEKKLHPVLVQAMTELTEYFAGTRKVFTVPVVLEGTDFQMQVWQRLRNIPYGETCSYGQVAKAVGNPKAARAVGLANNRNPVMIIVPCHRVIGKDGNLVGFGGGLDAKRYLLELEGGKLVSV